MSLKGTGSCSRSSTRSDRIFRAVRIAHTDTRRFPTSPQCKLLGQQLSTLSLLVQVLLLLFLLFPTTVVSLP